ncbi:MarR family transcriptional regulator [Streptomyces sp. SID13031]|uniref:SCO6745 family protein n=1 Tax=Streptomyces sp. SID13031 TaxID=2706046 RepID=UPI0013C9445E|nr:MarR family transcriptional regulator [Streptomyces sp. SID13031]NEA34984.1 MarR family transcriptional regulator [Streptomyces sp. SID13031]
MESMARRLKELFVPIHEVAYMADEAMEELQALGYEGYWPGYFAARSAPLGRVPAEVVDALFYNFAPGEVAACIPSVWDIATPEAALAAQQRGCVASLRRILGDLADSPAIARAAELATRAAFNAPMEGRLLYAGLRSLPVPEEPLARLWHAATLLREHRGDGHLTALVAAGIDGQEAHVLQALYWDMKPRAFGRLDPLADDQLDAVVDGLRLRGLVDAADGFTPAGRKLRTEIEELTDALAAPAYTCLEPHEIDELTTVLGPIAAKLKAASPF